MLPYPTDIPRYCLLHATLVSNRDVEAEAEAGSGSGGSDSSSMEAKAEATSLKFDRLRFHLSQRFPTGGNYTPGGILDLQGVNFKVRILF